jgi:hypothetical protein
MKRCLFDFPHTTPPSPGWHQEKMKIFILRDLLHLIVEVSGNNNEQKQEMEENGITLDVFFKIIFLA